MLEVIVKNSNDSNRKVAIEDEKVAIEYEKVTIEEEKVAIASLINKLQRESIGKVTQDNIKSIHLNIALNQVFGRKK